MKNKLAFIKALGKTFLSVLKIILILVLVFGGIIGACIISTDKTLSAYAGNIITGTLVFACIIIVIYMIFDDIKTNYENYIRKSSVSENTYEIEYELIKKDNKIIHAKTKRQAKQEIENELYKLLLSDNSKDDYKIIKIKEC